ncbi:MAG: tRNA lysidine(34) synthetase TilS [Thermodesulfobacteriota bacterium]|nr:tRNA lysidine(34) synthetase TilS [Thermodesulfobacteriota bacterium]
MQGSMQGQGADINRNLKNTMAQTMTRYSMVPPGCRILVGVSGGVDSVTLMHALTRLADRFAIAGIGVAHLHHGLRGEAADEDAALVATLSHERGLFFHMERVDIRAIARDASLSIEEAARITRYAFFRRTAGEHGYDRVATAHHADDNAELVLMNLLRGSGPDGLAGIPPVRSGPPEVIRPFIMSTRDQIENFAVKNGLSWAEDHTNTDVRFLRNRVRHDLLPSLKADYNPKLVDILNRLASIFTQEQQWLDGIVEGLLSYAVMTADPEALSLSAARLRRYHPAAQRRVVRKAIARVKGDLRRIGFDHVAAVLASLEKDQDFSLHLPDNIRVAKTGEGIVFSRGECRTPRREFSYTVFSHPDEAAQPVNATLALPEIGIKLVFEEVAGEMVGDIRTYAPCIGLFDMDALTFPLIVRSIRPGDRFQPLGMTGTQKVKDYFIDHKVSGETRRNCPVVESGGTLIWLVGHRIADPVKITPATRKILKIEMVEG